MSDFLVENLELSQAQADFLRGAWEWGKNFTVVIGVAITLYEKIFGNDEHSEVMEALREINLKLDAIITKLGELQKTVESNIIAEKKNALNASMEKFWNGCTNADTYRSTMSLESRQRVQTSWNDINLEWKTICTSNDTVYLPDLYHPSALDWRQGLIVKAYNFYPHGIGPYDEEPDPLNKFRVPGTNPPEYYLHWALGSGTLCKNGPGTAGCANAPFVKDGTFSQWSWLKYPLKLEVCRNGEPILVQIADKTLPPLEEAHLRPANLMDYQPRWDGRFYLPAILLGFFAWEKVTRTLEPYYRSTGNHYGDAKAVIEKLDQFANDWESALLWTREMGQWFTADCYFNGVWSARQYDRWPCAAVDPVFGVTVVHQGDFWTPVMGDIGLWTEQRKAAFKARRDELLEELKNSNGYTYFVNAVEAFERLVTTLPARSECLEIHSNKYQFTPGAKKELGHVTVGTILTEHDPESEIVTGYGKQPGVYQGTEEARTVTVLVPISVQPNPGVDYVPEVPRTAESDVVFGYRLSIETDTGPINLLDTKLRIKAGQPSLYHTGAFGEAGLRDMPYWTPEEPRIVTAKLPRRVALVDPTGTYYYSSNSQFPGPAEEYGEVTFGCRVRVCDTKQAIPGDDVKPQRASLWLEITSDNLDNYSFDVKFTIVETVRVAPNGKPPEQSNLEPATFEAKGTVPVDARVVVLPTEFFEENEEEAEYFTDVLAHQVMKVYQTLVKEPFWPPDPRDFKMEFDDPRILEDPRVLEDLADKFSGLQLVTLRQFKELATVGMAKVQQPGSPFVRSVVGRRSDLPIR